MIYVALFFVAFFSIGLYGELMSHRPNSLMASVYALGLLLSVIGALREMTN